MFSNRFRGLKRYMLLQFNNSSRRLSRKRSPTSQFSSRTVDNPHTGNGLPAKPIELPRYFPLTPWQKLTYRYHSSSKLRKANIWANVVVVSVFAYVIYTNTSIEVIPETGGKRFNCLSEKDEENYAKKSFIETWNWLYKVRNKSLILTEDSDVERMKRVRRLLEQILHSNKLDLATNWYLNPANLPYISPSEISRHKVIYIDIDTISLCADDNELAFQLSRQITTCISDPYVEAKSVLDIGLWMIPCMFLSQAVRFRPVLSISGTTITLICLSLISLIRATSDLDCLGMHKMARAGFDPRSAVQVVRREEQLDFSKQVGVPVESYGKEWPLTNRVQRIKTYVPEALALMPPTQLASLYEAMNTTGPVDTEEIVKTTEPAASTTEPSNDAARAESPPSGPPSNGSSPP